MLPSQHYTSCNPRALALTLQGRLLLPLTIALTIIRGLLTLKKLEAPPSIQLGGFVERCKLPHFGMGPRRSRQRFLCIQGYRNNAAGKELHSRCNFTKNTTSPSHMDFSIVFTKWCQCAPHALLDPEPTQLNPNGISTGSPSSKHIVLGHVRACPFPKNCPPFTTIQTFIQQIR